MNAPTRFPQTLADAIEAYVNSRGRGGFISTSSAVRTMRYLYPHCEHTDRELSDLVAAAAVRGSCAVAFEGEEHVHHLMALP